MTTVLLADRDGAALGAIGERIVPALLPLQSRPVLERMLEALVAGGIRSALLVVGPRAGEIERRFGKGIRWGIALEYVRRDENESVADVLRRLEPRLDGDTLVLRGDVGAHGAVGEFLEKVEGIEKAVVAAVSKGRPAGFWKVRAGALKTFVPPREPSSPEWACDPTHASLALEADVPLLDSIVSFRAADRAAAPSVSERATADPKALGPGSTVAEESVVLAGASLKETSVLPRTVIPSGVSLENAVVMGNAVVDAVTGASSLLSDRLPTPAPRLQGAADRLAGMFLLVLSLPLWPVAFFWGLLANAGHATRSVALNANAPGADGAGRPLRAPLRTFVFETAVPVLRDLPLVLALASGRLALTGVAPMPLADESALPEGWQKARLEAPVGLVAASRLFVPPSAPAEVPLLVDSFEARRPSSGLLAEAISALFGAKGWVAPKAWNPDDIGERTEG